MLRSLKRQRKQQRLTPFESFVDSEEQLSEWEREIDQQTSDLIDWLLSQWSKVPQFSEHYTKEKANFLAVKGLYLLFDASEKKPTQNVTLEFSLKTPLTIRLFLDIQLKAIETSLINDVDQQFFAIPGQFRL